MLDIELWRLVVKLQLLGNVSSWCVDLKKLRVSYKFYTVQRDEEEVSSSSFRVKKKKNAVAQWFL